MVAFRKSVGFDLSEPWGFSQYLIAAYGKGSLLGDDPNDPLLQPTYYPVDWAAEMEGRRSESEAGLRRGYERMLSAWLKAMAPSGLVCARGLHGMKLGDGSPDQIVEMIYDMQGLGSDGDERWRSDYTSYSQNLCIAVRWFATNNGRLGSRRETPIVIVARPKTSDIKSFGGDSESGDVNEAELHIKLCEPRCVERFFIASTTKIGKAVSADERRYYALDECVILTGRKMGFLDAPKLHLHPDTPGLSGGRIVRNLPDGWKWYELT
jgi:hypothetical protein